MATRLRMKLCIELFFTGIKTFWGVHVQVLAEILLKGELFSSLNDLSRKPQECIGSLGVPGLS